MKIKLFKIIYIYLYIISIIIIIINCLTNKLIMAICKKH